MRHACHVPCHRVGGGADQVAVLPLQRPLLPDSVGVPKRALPLPVLQRVGEDDGVGLAFVGTVEEVGGVVPIALPEAETDLAQPSAGVVEMIGAQGDAVAAFDVVL